jgi:hypothetical protein
MFRSSGRIWKRPNLAAVSLLRVRIVPSSTQYEVDFAILAVMVFVPCCAAASFGGSAKNLDSEKLR